MSVMYLKLDRLESVYHRMVMMLYTRLPRDKLAEYLGGLELLADDRQKTFFKIDLDILVPPKQMNLQDWLIVSITMKSSEKKSIDLFINLFYINFPHKTYVNQKTEDTFVASGNSSGRPMNALEMTAYKRLSAFLKHNQDIVVECAQEFRSETRSAETVVDVMIGLARKYEVYGGHWLCFFGGPDKNKYEQIFDYLLNAFCTTQIQFYSNRFNAKLSSENIIISFGNAKTMAAIDPTIMKYRNSMDEQDEEVRKVRQSLDKIYNPQVLGNLCMKYKPDIVSNCCIQRNSMLRPTVYTRNYNKRYEQYVTSTSHQSETTNS
uniref:Uncharacterized protein n=1 Tax=Ditylenchus dipsaci TaxID=166011 RepID=A0A915CUP4_9BILA